MTLIDQVCSAAEKNIVTPIDARHEQRIEPRYVNPSSMHIPLSIPRRVVVDIDDLTRLVQNVLRRRSIEPTVERMKALRSEEPIWIAGTCPISEGKSPCSDHGHF